MDIVEKMRVGWPCCPDFCRIRNAASCCCTEAADEIERLRKREDDLVGWVAREEAENERLRAALHAIRCGSVSGPINDEPLHAFIYSVLEQKP